MWKRDPADAERVKSEWRRIMKSLASRSLSHVLGFVFVIGAGAAQASPLNFELLDDPDIAVGFINLSYDASQDELVANGIALEMDNGGVSPEAILGGTFDLTSAIDASGMLTGGSLSIGGTILSLGFDSGTLLTGDLTAFGFRDTGGDPLEWVFNVTGGDAAGLYAAGPGGVIVTNSGFGGSFDVDFDNGGQGVGVANVGVVPLPGTMCLALFGLGMIAAVKRRRT